MARKKPESLAQARANMRRAAKRGSRVTRVAVSEQNLDAFDRRLKRELACHYKASGYPYAEIAKQLDLTTDVIKKWFQEQEMQDYAAKLQEDMVDAAVKYGQTRAFEMLDMLANIARDTDDDKVAIQAIAEYLDRIGLTKVNKSESKSAATVRKESEVQLVDKSGILEALAEGAPPEVLHRAAEIMDELFSLTAEHTDKDVTHAE